ncbi:sensor of ECF-type sigma factor [Aureivirga marina]|uniref:sensor of ECF-type sigma factor n=1 Tax=Aureivirga marina TaxID=1182451 RepID=UPI0018C9D646|nr:sensor of ECF-type sigma factor [Aureivirga marina]
MKVHIYIVTFFLFIFTSYQVNAQRPPRPHPPGKMSKERMEKIRALKVAYITETLDLSVKEAQEFWPLYNAYEDKHDENRKKEHRVFKKIKEADSFSETEAKKLLIDIENIEQRNYTSKVEFYKKIQQILPPKKIVLLRKAEIDFNRKLLKQFKLRHRNQIQERYKK